MRASSGHYRERDEGGGCRDSRTKRTASSTVTTIHNPRGDRSLQQFFFVAAMCVLGQTLAQSNGHQDDTAMKLLSVTLALTVIGVIVPDFNWARRWAQPATIGLLALGLIWQFAMLAHNAPGMYLHPRTGWQTLWFLLGLSSAAVLAGSGLTEKPFLGRARMPLILLIHFLLGMWLINASPRPIIDVDLIQRESVAGLLSGHNPYELTFQNIYGNTAFFGNKIADAQRINVGFPYPPLSLLLAIPGQALFGDYRYSQLTAMVIAGALMAYSRPGRVAPAIATLFLFTPRVLFVLEQGWTDPFLVLLAAITVFTALRHPKILPYAFGLLMVVKQYAVLAGAFVWLLLQPFEWKAFARIALKAAAIALLVTLPFVLWNPSAFFFSTGGAHGGTPFRADALSYPAWLGAGQPDRWSNMSLIALAVAFGIGTWRAARTPAGFASALALLTFGFFAFSGHAFCNHYYWILGLISLAAAASGAEQKRAPAT
jgi:hypothetical protein